MVTTAMIRSLSIFFRFSNTGCAGFYPTPWLQVLAVNTQVINRFGTTSTASLSLPRVVNESKGRTAAGQFICFATLCQNGAHVDCLHNLTDTT